jgi:hypothetical protein
MNVTVVVVFGIAVVVVVCLVYLNSELSTNKFKPDFINNNDIIGEKNETK